MSKTMHQSRCAVTAVSFMNTNARGFAGFYWHGYYYAHTNESL